MDPDPKYEQWLGEQPDFLTRDAVWRMAVYRIASYVVHVAWPDVSALARNPITRGIASQLYEALDSVPSNIAEGYSRSSGKDRVRLFEYALGSTREGVCHYRTGIPVLGRDTVLERQGRLQGVVRMLSVIIPQERRRRIGD